MVQPSALIFQPDFIFTATSHQDQKTGNNLSAAKFFGGKVLRRKTQTKINKPQRKDATGAKPMNNSNPFVPQGSLLAQQSKRRSRMKLGVFCVLAVSVTGLMAILIQGCKREQAPETDNGMPPAPTNDLAMTDTNPPPFDVSNTAPVVPANPPVVVPAPVEPAGPNMSSSRATRSRRSRRKMA